MAVIEPKTVILKNGKKVCIRTAAENDIPGIIAYWKAIFVDDRCFHNTTVEAKEWQTSEKEREHIERHNSNHNNLMLITEADGHVISLCAFECEDKIRTRHTGEVGISILPEYRRMGLGTAIMQAMVDWAAGHPVIEKLMLGVWSRNEPAIRLYEKIGFKEEGRFVRYVKYADGTYDDMVCMYRFVK